MTQSCLEVGLVPELHSSFTNTVNTWLEPFSAWSSAFLNKVPLQINVASLASGMAEVINCV